MVTDDAGQAVAWTRVGLAAVLIAASGADPAVKRAQDAAGPGRLAILVGEPSDAFVEATAQVMDAELFGAATDPARPAPDSPGRERTP